MIQSRKMSMIESLTGTFIGFVVSVSAACVVYPLFGHAFTLTQNVAITAIFTVISVIRGYIVRRIFNRMR